MARKGDTAMKHARAWVAERYPGPCRIGPPSAKLTCPPFLEAGARLARYPDPRRRGEWITHTVREDLFGVFDLAVFPLADWQGGLQQPSDVHLIQVTTATVEDLAHSSAVQSRRKKVADWVKATFKDGPPSWIGPITLLAWVPRRHFLQWDWDWEVMGWRRLPEPSQQATGTGP